MGVDPERFARHPPLRFPYRGRHRGVTSWYLSCPKRREEVCMRENTLLGENWTIGAFSALDKAIYRVRIRAIRDINAGPAGQYALLSGAQNGGGDSFRPYRAEDLASHIDPRLRCAPPGANLPCSLRERLPICISFTGLTGIYTGVLNTFIQFHCSCDLGFMPAHPNTTVL